MNSKVIAPCVPTANASNSIAVYAEHLIWTSVQAIRFFGCWTQNTGGTHGCYYSRGIDQEALPLVARAACRGAIATLAHRHRGDCPLRRDRRLRRLVRHRPVRPTARSLVPTFPEAASWHSITRHI